MQLLRALLWLLAGCQATTTSAIRTEMDGHDGEVMEIASLLAMENACEDSQELFSRHFTDLLASVLGRRKLAQGGGLGDAPGEGAGGATADGGVSEASVFDCKERKNRGLRAAIEAPIRRREISTEPLIDFVVQQRAMLWSSPKAAVFLLFCSW